MKNTRLTGSGCGSVVDWLLPRPEIWSSHPVIGKFYFLPNLSNLCDLCGKDESKEKRVREWPIKKGHSLSYN